MTKSSILVFIALLAGCAGGVYRAESYKPASGAQFADDRESCMRQSQFNSSGNAITFGGGYGGNAFYSSGPYMDCMVARGYAAEAIGDPLGTPAMQRSIGGY